jgi:hypothetical protein
MRKFEVAAMCTLPTDDGLIYAMGQPEGFSVRPLLPFEGVARTFLAQLSTRMIADAATRTMPDVMSFAWWCRKANIERLAKTYNDGELRIGRGLAFHVTPTNVPVNFAFSWAFSLLAGNANVVRLPNRDFPQIPFIVGHIAALMDEDPLAELRSMNAFVAYGHQDKITAAFSAIADARIVWGGDATIQTIRKSLLPPRGIDVCFSDRTSLCILGAARILELEHKALERLAASFYNDAYIMDQNACSSPRLVVWLGEHAETEQASERLWKAVRAEVERRYELSGVASVDKLTQACRDAIELSSVTELLRSDNRIYRLRLNSLTGETANRRCGSGYFYEYVTDQIDDMAAVVTSQVQTLTYFGVPREELASFVRQNRVCGIDRIVPVGEAMDIGLIWDGYDLIRTLSRICDIR